MSVSEREREIERGDAVMVIKYDRAHGILYSVAYGGKYLMGGCMFGK